MAQSGQPPTRLLAGLREEVVTRSDGRYLLYYSWPPETGGPPASEAGPDGDASEPGDPQRSHPPLAPRSTEFGPTDV